jgi:hypothetical protein
MPCPFDTVQKVALRLPGVTAETKYDGSPVLKVGGSFMAGLAMHHSAEPGSLIIRVAPDERQFLLDEAPDVYYLTDHYRKHPVVLVRMARMTSDVLLELLTMSRRLTLTKHLIQS